LPSLLEKLPPPPTGRTGWPWTTATEPPPDAATVAWPRITVVMPSYQQAAFVEEGLRSVLLQNYPNLEFIVNDGGSRDGSAEIIARYAPFLAHAQSARDGGQGNAINQGFDRATGDILGWLNSDDLYLPGALYAVAREFLRGRADIVFGDALNLYEDHARALEYWQAYWVRPQFLQFGGVISSHAVFWRRTVHARIWDELNCNVDGELWQRLVPGRRLRYLPLPLGVCRQHGESKSSAEQWKRKWQEDDARIWARHGRPTRNPLYLRWFNYSQRFYKWFTWRRNPAAKRATLAACGWSDRPWRGPTP
jgi:glycosyltransferase involved in cell wall biosynthesis